MNTTNVENNPGPASILVFGGERGIELTCGTIIAEGDVQKNPFSFPTEAKSHTCEFDEKRGIARRRYDKKVEKANFEIMKQSLDTRKEQGRDTQEAQEELEEMDI